MYRIHLSILTLSLCSALQISPVERNADDICIRNDGKPGYCVHMRNCSLISSMIERKKQGIPLTSDEQVYMRNSGCPVYRRGHVCCESEDKVAQGLRELSSHYCGKFATKKTIGGREINLMSRPWMALLKFRTMFDTEEFTCGGTLIHKNWILTAAHCFNNQKLLSVRLGEHNTTSETDCERRRGQDIRAPPVENFEIDRVFLHEQYSTGSAHNDIALVKLKSEAKITESIRPICLPVNETIQRNVETLQSFFITGWGRTENETSSEVPLETIVTARNRSSCQASFTRKIVPTQICAGDRGKDSCNGDSGGPLLYVDVFKGQQRFVQFGIVSFGSRTCGDGNPGVYTNVGSYTPWIAYKIATK
ncbi:hypothetical protein ACLKA7_012814 [Drosophila subpalustris]